MRLHVGHCSGGSRFDVAGASQVWMTSKGSRRSVGHLDRVQLDVDIPAFTQHRATTGDGASPVNS